MTANDVPTTLAPDVEPVSPLLLSPEELESLLDVEEGAEPVAVPAAVPEAGAEAEAVVGEVEATNGLESEEIDAWVRSKSNCR